MRFMVMEGGAAGDLGGGGACRESDMRLASNLVLEFDIFPNYY